MKSLFSKIDQLGFVVTNLWERVHQLYDNYGIGPWMIVKFGGEDGIPIQNVELFGKAVGTYSILNAVCDLPDGLQLELIEPLDSDSIFSYYLKTRGPCLQHISVSGVDFEESIRILHESGFVETQRAIVDQQELCVFCEQPALGICFELHKREADFHFPDVKPTFYPENISSQFSGKSHDITELSNLIIKSN